MIDVVDIYPFEKQRYLKAVYGTERTDHPGARMVLDDPREHLVGGEIQMLPPAKHPEYGDVVLTPRETRAPLRQARISARRRVSDAQSSPPRSRVCPGRRLGAADPRGALRRRRPQSARRRDQGRRRRRRLAHADLPRLIDNKVLGQGDIDEELWKNVGRNFNDHVMLLGLDIKMFYAGPKEAVMHAIYRQNFGFTDIVIGRKHADAPLRRRQGHLGRLGRPAQVRRTQGRPADQAGQSRLRGLLRRTRAASGSSMSTHRRAGNRFPFRGRDLRDKLTKGELPDERIMRPETAQVLIERMKK